MKTNMKMKIGQTGALLAAALLCAGSAMAQSTNSFTFATGQAIPDADPNGLALTYNLDLSGISGPGRTITDVTVGMDITGGYNGDLYAYLAGPNGGFAVLLNRTGVGAGTGTPYTFGYSDTGFNVTLDDTAASSIQYYQNSGYPASLNGSGQLTGTWQPEGVSIDPQSAPSLFASPPGSPAMLSSFDNTDPSGTWTLFLADLAAGNQSVEGSITVNIVSVPEPATLPLAAIGGLALLALLALRHSRQRRQ
jgi:subtilisin-like proprotein convertase family protein